MAPLLGRHLQRINFILSIRRAMSSEANTTKWYPPVTKDANSRPVLKLYNTLTHSKVEFVPEEAGKIKWYSCGPTVYNPSHMGHARNYVSIDINRRILQDYFNYDILFIQNVTDIDDKIIIKARQEYLFEKFVNKFDRKVTTELKERAEQSVSEYVKKNLPEFEKTGDILNSFNKWASTLNLKEIGLEKPKFPMHVKAVNLAISAINNDKIDFDKFVNSVKDVVVLSLDKEFGHEVTDPNIFRKCSSYWERQFDLDMEKLNVLKPSIVTRVSEYIPEIIEFVDKIVKRGYAYVTSDGSVYFNTSRFDKDEKHQYAKCQPWSKGDMELLEDGEGSLTNEKSIENKLNSSDFALWKSSKSGEPFWDSPWGQGRPGWHIECSVMGSDFVGEKMDIHSGGIDLAFPHHDNEMAQSEAHYDCQQWVNYFLHTGHLHIEGQKMSKSLKNFITIDEALEKYSARELRLIFSLVQWNNPLDFKESLLNEAKSIESTFDKFFSKMRALARDNEEKLAKGEIVSKKFGALEKKLLKDFEASKDKFHASLCDNLATPMAIRNLGEVINNCNIYISESGSALKVDLLVEIVKYITKMLEMFGFEVRGDRMGWTEVARAGTQSTVGSGGHSGGDSFNREDVCMPFVKVLSGFRDVVRETCIKNEEGGAKKLLEKCDSVRDGDLLRLGVALDDRGDGQGALVKFLNDSERDELLKQQAEREAVLAEKAAKKAAAAKAAFEKEKLRLERGKVPPKEMFQTDEMRQMYSAWDEEGLPLRTVDGEEVSKSARKKLAKQQLAQTKLHKEYLDSLNK